MSRIYILILYGLISSTAFAQNIAQVHLSTFSAGIGPSHEDGVYRLLDGNETFGQSNAIAFDVAREGTYAKMSLRCKLRVLEGGDGGSFIFLNTAEYGRRGPAPFLKSWVEPNLVKTFAVGIDVHNPPNDDPYGPWGNYQGRPQREVSLHWDGREIVKRVAIEEFRGHFTELEIYVNHVTGGAEISVMLAGAKIYDHYFVAGMQPYESRIVIGAGTHEDLTTEFDVENIEFRKDKPARPGRSPSHFVVFNHIKINNSAPFQEKEVLLPPLHWAYGRVIMTLEIHDAGPDWEKWDRIGYVNIIDSEGIKHDILPFITSFRTPWLWQVDVTHFRPWLAGRVRFEIGAGTNFEKNHGYIMNVALDFYHGVPELEPYRILTIWSGEAKYGSPDNHFSDFFKPRAVEIDAATEAARLFITTTGHSRVGEFTRAGRTVIFAPEKGGDPSAEKRFDNVLWKTDNYLNPNRPQFGSWKYARAGWAPGDVVRPWWIDLTPYIIPGKMGELRYEPKPYDFSGIPEDKRPAADEISRAIHLVRAYLILYRTPEDLIEAPYLQVVGVEDNSNAAEAEIEEGDYLESYDDRKPQSIEELREAIRIAKEEGRDKLEVVIHRGSKRLKKIIGAGRMGVLLEEQ